MTDSLDGFPEGFPVHPARGVLAGLDGLDQEGPVLPESPKKGARRLRLSEEAAERVRAEIHRAGGREVCFLASVDEDRVVRRPRAVSRGNFQAVLVAARDAEQGEVMLHNHPSGVLEPSDADMNIAAQIYEQGLGTAIVDNAAENIYVVVEPPAPRVVEPLELERFLC